MKGKSGGQFIDRGNDDGSGPGDSGSSDRGYDEEPSDYNTMAGSEPYSIDLDNGLYDPRRDDNPDIIYPMMPRRDQMRLIWKYVAKAAADPKMARLRHQTCHRIITIGMQLDKQRCHECDGYGHKDGACGYRKRLYALVGACYDSKNIFNSAHVKVVQRRGKVFGQRAHERADPFDWRDAPAQINRRQVIEAHGA